MPIFVFLSAITGLVACAGNEVLIGRCDPAAARTLVGHQTLTDEEARQRTGAAVVRQIAPGQPVTHDYREGRVTLENDPASGRGVVATCG